MNHTEDCIKSQELIKLIHDSYAEKYPNYCKHCGGWGGQSVWQSHGPGPREHSFEECEHCVCQGKCPRCGNESLNDDLDVCSECGWTWEKEGIMEWEGCECFT